MGNPEPRLGHLQAALRRRGLPASDVFVRLVEGKDYLEETAKLLRQNVDAIFTPGGMGGLITAYAFNLLGRRVSEKISQSSHRA